MDPLLDLDDPQQWNGYAYANNAPSTSSDPSRLMYTSNSHDDSTAPAPRDSCGNGVYGLVCTRVDDVVEHCLTGTMWSPARTVARKFDQNPLPLGDIVISAHGRFSAFTGPLYEGHGGCAT